MPGRNLDHRADSHDVPFLLHERLSYLEIIYGVRKLGDYSKDMLLNEVAYQI
jgi:hypothetical protein